MQPEEMIQTIGNVHHRNLHVLFRLKLAPFYPTAHRQCLHSQAIIFTILLTYKTKWRHTLQRYFLLKQSTISVVKDKTPEKTTNASQCTSQREINLSRLRHVWFQPSCSWSNILTRSPSFSFQLLMEFPFFI